MTHYYTVREAAQRLKTSPKTIRRMARRGDIQAVRVGRQWRVLLPSLGGAA